MSLWAMFIRPLFFSDLDQVKIFTDQEIGLNYFTAEELKESYTKSLFKETMCSFVLIDDKEKIRGLRLAYPPGAWSKGKGSKLNPDLWKTPLAKTGYFQSLFLSTETQGQGWGAKLSEAAIESFKKLETLAIVTHAWKESPNNSSVRYLKKMGFQHIATHPEYWIDVDYECVLDGKPCRCTAEEMIKYL